MGSLYGYEVKSELPLARLNAAPGTRGALTIAEAKVPLKEPDRDPDGVLESNSGQRWYATYEDGNRCLLLLPPTGAFLLEPEPLRISVERRGSDEELFEHRIASAAACSLLSMRGDLVLHAAAVEDGGEAVVFCGPSHRGKSTLARTLGELGAPLLGEDGIAIELGPDGPLAYPGARGVRMRPRDGGPEVTLSADPGPREPAPQPVRAVVLLDERGQSLEVGVLEPIRALPLLTPNLVHTGSRKSIGNAFARLARLLHDVPAFSASLPDDLERLPASARDLLASAHPRG
jgi:hypothetical protein